MHDIRAIRSDPAAFDAGLKRRGLEPLSAELLALDEQRRAAMTAAETLLAERNAASKAIGAAMAAKDVNQAEKLKAQVAENKEKIAALESQSQELDSKLQERLAAIPNTPLDEVPLGADEHGNVEYRRHGTVPSYTFEPKEHYELGEALGQMDFETAVKLSGARFVVLQKGLARLERALGQFMLDLHTGTHGYTEVNPPILVKDDAMFGTAQLPKFEEDQYYGSYIPPLQSNNAISDEDLDVFRKLFTDQNHQKKDKKFIIDEEYLRHTFDDDRETFIELFLKTEDLVKSLKRQVELGEEIVRSLISSIDERFKSLVINRHWLIPTAEVPLTNLVRESILSEEELPKRFTALTPCFRAEAGSAGRDTRGMLRQHQFNKVELVSITTPEQAGAEHERMVSAAEAVLKALGLHFRTMTLCTGDMGFASRKTYDIEVWLPGQKTYREISSCSQCGDFQARRMQARYRAPGDKNTRFVHTLNGSGVAVGRCLIAVMENYQNADGSITVPDALLPYMGGVTRIEKA